MKKKKIIAIPNLSTASKSKEIKQKESQPKRSNNPYGRPKGSKNVSSKLIIDRIVSYLEEDANDEDNGIFANIENVKNVRHRALLKIELYKLVLPKPKSEEDMANEKRIADGLHAMYFNVKKTKE